MSVEAIAVTAYCSILIITYGLFIYQTVLLRRIAKNTAPKV